MISVVMANYNGDRHIAEAMRSVVEQQFEDYEFIIVDDGSTDDSPRVIADFEKQYPQRITAIYQSENRGQGAGFNAGIAVARGEIVSFIDSDDIWLPQKLRVVSEVFSKTDDVAIHQHNLFLLRDDTLTREKYRDILHCGDYFRHTQQTREIPHFMPTSGLSMSRRVLNQVLPIPDGFRTCADGFLTRTCFCFGDVAATTECLGAYRVHADNHTFQNQQFDMGAYLDELLVPALHQYYQDHNIDLNYNRPAPQADEAPVRSWRNRVLDLSLRRIINWMPVPVPHRTPSTADRPDNDNS